MGSRLTTHLAGLAVPMEPAALLDALAANDGSATGSSYSQTGPRPGVSVPRDGTSTLVPVVSGGLGADVELVTLRPGDCGLADEAAEIGWRLAGETGADIRGWSAPIWCSGCWPVLGASTPDARGAICTVPGTQRVVAALPYASKVYVRTFDPADADGAWGAAVEVHDGAAAGVALVALDDNSLLLLVLDPGNGMIYRSTDGGDTWSFWRRHSIGASTTRLHAAYSGGQILLVESSTTTIRQYASPDRFGTLALVATITDVAQAHSSVYPLPGGGFIVAYKAQGTLYPCVRIVPSAFSDLSEAAEIEIVASACSTVGLSVDPDGLIWAYVTDASTPGQAALYLSTDSGTTWVTTSALAWDLCSTSADYIAELLTTTAAGATYLLCEPTGSTSGADEAMVVRLGGWETITARGDALSFRVGPTLGSWLPFELPGDTGQWTRTAAGTPTESLVAAGLYHSTDPGGTDAVSYTRTTSTWMSTTLELGMRVDAGGSASADEIVTSVDLANTVADYAFKVRWYASGGTVWCNVRDPNAGTPSKATVDTAIATASSFRLRLHIEPTSTGAATAKGYLWVAGPNDTQWTEVWSGTLTNNSSSPGSTGQVLWGLPTTPASTTAEAYVSYALIGGYAAQQLGGGVQTASNVGAAGRPISVYPIPLHPELADADGLVPWIQGVSGPGTLGEVFDVDRDYDYPIEAVLPTVSPSPATRWRSTDTSEQVLAWDMGAATWWGDSVALIASGLNFREALLEYHNGSIWVTTGTLDLGWDGIDYSLSGDTVIPGASTAAAPRYLQEGELAGGHVILETGSGSGTAAYRVRWNTAGFWVPSGSGLPRARVMLEGDTTAADAAGAAVLVWPAGVVVVHYPIALRARRWRWRIASGQDTPDGYYEAGCLVPMAVRALGAPPDWGWSRERQPNAEIRTSRSGTTRGRKLGAVPTTWALAWTSGTDLTDIRSGGGDYVGPSTGLPLTAAEDVGWLLGGLLELTESGVVPVVALAEIPDASDEVITDPTMWLLGRAGGSVRMENAGGTEGDSEVYRVSQFEVRKLV